MTTPLLTHLREVRADMDDMIEALRRNPGEVYLAWDEAVRLLLTKQAALALAIEALDVANDLLSDPILVVKNWGMEESQCFACGADPEYVSDKIRKHRPDCRWVKFAALARLHTGGEEK